MSKIYTVDFDVNIIDLISDCLLKDNSANMRDLSSHAVVFPGRRPQFYLRKALANRINESFLPPQIFSIEEFIQHLAKKNSQLNLGQVSNQPISLIDACFLIYKVIQNLQLTYIDWQKQLGFEHFFFWARKILHFLEELDKELISERHLLDLQENAQIGLPLPDNINQLLENINRIHKEFHKYLEENKLTTTGFNYYRTAQSIDKINLDEFKKIYFVGFFALNACEKKIIKYLLDRELAVLFWQKDTDKWSIFEELEEFFAIRAERINARIISSAASASARRLNPQIQIYEAFDTHSQMATLNRALLNLGCQEDTCIVLPKADALMPLLYQALPPDLSNYNISLGYPLKRTPIYALINMIIQAQERKRRDGSFYAKDYLNVLMHPYIKNISDDKLSSDMNRILIHKIEEALLGIDKGIDLGKRAFIRLEDIENSPLIFQIVANIISKSDLAQIEPADLRRHLVLIHQKSLCVFDRCKTLVDFVQATQGLLHFILHKGKAFSDIFSVEVFNQFLEMLDGIGGSIFSQEIIKERSIFFELLKICLSSENIPFSGTSIGSLQILGLLETRNLQFNNLFILDCNEGILPKTDKGESLIPEGILPILGLAHYHKREQIMRYHFRRLLGGARNAALFYQSNFRNSESRSRFIEEIIWQGEKRDKRLFDSSKIKHIEFKVIPTKEKFSLRKSPKTNSILKQYIFSPTSLDTYLRCPARFYFRYCLGLKKKEEISEELEASDIGNLLHCLLLHFYSLFLNKPVILDNHAYTYLLELKEKKLKEFFPQNTGERFLLSRIIDYRLEKFFKQEARRKERIKILYLEQELPFGQKRVRMESDHGPVYLKGKLDRVDERTIGGKRRIVILDYKTGYYNLPKKDIHKIPLNNREDIKRGIGSLQLPLYIYLLAKCKGISPLGIEAGFYSLKDTKEELLFGDNGGVDKPYDIYLSAVARICSEILCPDSYFMRDDSDEYYCCWCPFPGLCKR